MNQTVRALKKSLRKEMSAKLSTLTADVVDRESKVVTEKLLALNEYQKSRNVSIFISMSGEIVTRAIIQDLFQKKKTCYVPRWGKDEMEMVRLESWEDFLSLPVNRWNIPEPSHEQARDNGRVGPDNHARPRVRYYGEQAGAWQGVRGKPGSSMQANVPPIIDASRLLTRPSLHSYYDRYLAKCEEWARAAGRSQPKTVALALEMQVLEADRIPTNETDRKPDLIVTAERMISQE
ncbi:5-formyltetrahydrofolate cyclo-ligase family-domain-containing protein [Jimgerdemannia flammicorona]|uniref:5-formyltetrahydrofolate cyclo-ligase n=1 Tax=Jimgerdemannia flammicorona TaxID=994334 RepID=A0A433QYN4_9FUNG|nr:5-formyltetrahydrofolate cyclo-ligase family-domain-containing protein [Jimgerdemannia flammicorona]